MLNRIRKLHFIVFNSLYTEFELSTHKQRFLFSLLPNVIAGGHRGQRRRAIRPRESGEGVRRNQGRSQGFGRFGNQGYPPYLRSPARNLSGAEARVRIRISAGDSHGRPGRRAGVARCRGGADSTSGQHGRVLPGDQPRRPGAGAPANSGGGEGVPRAARGGQGTGVP